MTSPARPLPVTARRAAAGAIRVMIVDDSLTVRTIFKRMVESDPTLVVAGTASSAERGIAQLATEPADVVLLDLEMPGMGGLDALPAILATPARPKVLVVSSLTVDGAEHSLAALQMGAADTLLKPRPGGFTEDYRAQLLGKIRALGTPATDVASEAPEAARRSFARPDATGLPPRRPEVVAIGASTGGIHALGLLLGALGPRCELPLLITQHLPPSFVPVFARQVENACGRPADIAAEGTEVRPGRILIAPGHSHMLVRRSGDRLTARLSTEPVPSGCLPSVDPMLASLAQACDGRALGVILSGMGRDGVLGAQELVNSGGTVYVQDADSSAVWGMPGAIAKAGLASLIASPGKIGETIMARLAAPLARQS
ncbi:chemotaxis-specific protein-glutamate methyltransferase CheB [Erythrobacter dokdonensis]|uniref:chemotaxis-specific protein-glutamate methyltransferase CheB n=1 Tax=Erythrobacter dokdonensis TaxID=328225 RepID=UPI000AC73377|nr:chemotaxis-specific protein-glutamate methyltransferase CheB [Erythrobacter dokdonensis]